MYVIKTTGNKGVLYLADRNKTKEYWWTYEIKLVMKFNSLVEADRMATKLKHNNPTVITLDEAYKIRSKITSDYLNNKIDNMRGYDPGDSEYWDNKDF